MGGLFLHTVNPPSTGTVIELVFGLKNGDVRARANVRYTLPGKGMGLQFVQMQPTDRARLNQFLLQYSSAQAINDGKAAGSVPPTETSGAPEKHSDKTGGAPQFEREIGQLLELARQGTYYQLLGVSSESNDKQIKQSFYAFARKFHPDHHMEKKECLEPLRNLMATGTAAYKTLMNAKKRASYDARLAASGAFTLQRPKTASQNDLEDCILRAKELLRAQNYVGSIVWLRKCVDLAPDDPKYHALLARSLGMVPQYRSESIKHFEVAIELDPWNAAVYIQFSELYEEMDQKWKARPLYAKVLEIDPLNAVARERLSG